MRHRGSRVAMLGFGNEGGAFGGQIGGFDIRLGQQFGDQVIASRAGFGEQSGRHKTDMLHNRTLLPLHHLGPGIPEPWQQRRGRQGGAHSISSS